MMGEMEIPDELIDRLLGEYEGPEQLTGPDGSINQLRRRLIERAAGAELQQHLGYPAGGEPPEGQPNRRNGVSAKTLRTVDGPVTVELPRDRDASFEPRIVPKYARSFDGFDEQILALYAGGMTTREIQRHLRDSERRVRLTEHHFVAGRRRNLRCPTLPEQHPDRLVRAGLAARSELFPHHGREPLHLEKRRVGAGGERNELAEGAKGRTKILPRKAPTRCEADPTMLLQFELQRSARRHRLGANVDPGGREDAAGSSPESDEAEIPSLDGAASGDGEAWRVEPRRQVRDSGLE